MVGMSAVSGSKELRVLPAHKRISWQSAAPGEAHLQLLKAAGRLLLSSLLTHSFKNFYSMPDL